MLFTKGQRNNYETKTARETEESLEAEQSQQNKRSFVYKE